MSPGTLCRGPYAWSEMRREEPLIRSLVEMADTLVDDYDVIDLLTGCLLYTSRCV